MIRVSLKKSKALRVPLVVGMLAAGLAATATTPALAQSSGTWTRTGDMKNARDGAAAILLQNGQVLVAGGNTNTVQFGSAELYNPATGQWTNTGSMNTVRIEQFAALLTSGQVLVLFGDGTTITRTELYNPGTGTWTVNGNTGATAQFSFSVTLLNTGKVLIAGGANCVYPRPCVEVSSAELYDPSVGASTFTGSLNIARSSHSATLLANGQVLAAGGQTENNVHKFSFTNSAELYTP